MDLNGPEWTQMDLNGPDGHYMDLELDNISTWVGGWLDGVRKSGHPSMYPP